MLGLLSTESLFRLVPFYFLGEACHLKTQWSGMLDETRTTIFELVPSPRIYNVPVEFTIYTALNLISGQKRNDKNNDCCSLTNRYVSFYHLKA